MTHQSKVPVPHTCIIVHLLLVGRMDNGLISAYTARARCTHWHTAYPQIPVLGDTDDICKMPYTPTDFGFAPSHSS